jgi:hypothetical protein
MGRPLREDIVLLDSFVGCQFCSREFWERGYFRKGTSYTQGDRFSVCPLAQGEFMFLRSVAEDCDRLVRRAISAGV